MGALRSWLAGTAGLFVLLVASGVIWRARPLMRLDKDQARGLTAVGLLAWLLQAAHFSEEALTGFPSAFPGVLGLLPWSPWAFVAFNLGWLAIWMVCIVTAPRGHRLAEWPLWFLGLALVINGLAHPLLALATGGYFPGLATSVLAAVGGGLLLRRLVGASVDGASRD